MSFLPRETVGRWGGVIPEAAIIYARNLTIRKSHPVDTEIIKVLGKSLVVATVAAYISNVIAFGTSELANKRSIKVESRESAIKGRYDMLPDTRR